MTLDSCPSHRPWRDRVRGLAPVAPTRRRVGISSEPRPVAGKSLARRSTSPARRT